MAIKGKSKGKSRSGSPRRRAVTPIRPTATVASRPPWYRTMAGQLAAIFALLAVIGVIVWRVEAASAAAAKLEARQDRLASYTDEVGNYVGEVQQTIREMLGAPFNTSNPEGLASLEASAEGWIEVLETNAALVQSVQPPDDLVAPNVTLQQSFMMYSSSAKIYALVDPEEPNRDIQGLLDRAQEVRDQAGVVMGSALGMLDEARRAAEMPASGIDIPAQLTPILPSPAPVEDDGGGKGKKRNDDG